MAKHKESSKYLRAVVNQKESTVQEVHKAARSHTQMSKGTAGATFFPRFGRFALGTVLQGTAGATEDYRPQGETLSVISPELTSELLHCLSTLSDMAPWVRSRSIWRNQASGFPNCANSTLLTNMPGEQLDGPRLHRSQTLRQRSRRSRKSSQSLKQG